MQVTDESPSFDSDSIVTFVVIVAAIATPATTVLGALLWAGALALISGSVVSSIQVTPFGQRRESVSDGYWAVIRLRVMAATALVAAGLTAAPALF